MKAFTRLAFAFQIVMTHFWHTAFIFANRSELTAIGPDEISGLTDRAVQYTNQTAKVLLSPGLFSWSSSKNLLERGFRSKFLKFIFGPALLGFIARRFRGALYFGKAGYIISTVDFREWEFRFLYRNGVEISSFLTGGDIRSPAKAREAVRAHIPESISDYLGLIDPFLGSDLHELQQKNVAEVIDRYCKKVINAPLDQASYLKSATESFLYFSHVDRFSSLPERAGGLTRIVHIPSRPLLKGTQVVRAAIRALELEGKKVVYEEIHEKQHSEVLAAIERSHVVVNELYSLLPGMLGIEALEMGRVLVTSAPVGVEDCLPVDGQTPWLEGNSLNLQATLRRTLEMSDEALQTQARIGWDWVVKHHNGRESGRRLSRILLS